MKKFIKTKTTPTILITSGCSFTYVSDACSSWPLHLSESLDVPLLNTAMGSQGNGMIARKAIWAVHEQLKTTPADQLLVGVMWSGPSRHEQYVSKEKFLKNLKRNTNGWIKNPISYVDNDPGGWVIYNSNWTIAQAQVYYRHVYDPIFSQVQTLEHVIRVQHYLKLHNIKYFMTAYTDEVFRIKDNPNLDHLYEQLDFDYFLPVTSEHGWLTNNTTIPFHPDGLHPSDAQHELFTKEVIVPFLKEKYNIDIPN